MKIIEDFQNTMGRLPIININSPYNPLSPINKRLSEYNSIVQKEIEGLRRQEKFRKEFIANVSHELKTPLFAAQGFVHTLLDGAAEDILVRNKFLKKAARSLDGLDNLVRDLLILSSIETRNVQMDFEYFDILRLTKDVAGQFENKLQKKNIRIKISSSLKRQVVVFGDWQRIRQVLNNLISNAITYSNEGGFIEITIKKQEKTALLSVRDSGIGIPERDLERIFERFYRVDKSRSRDSGGTGLGLAIVKHIMECHNQKINVKSNLNSGTIFSFHLPLKEEDF